MSTVSRTQTATAATVSATQTGTAAKVVRRDGLVRSGATVLVGDDVFCDAVGGGGIVFNSRKEVRDSAM